LRVAIAQVTDVDSPGNRVQEYGGLLASLDTETAAIALLRIDSHNADFFIPREGISIAGRETFLTLGAKEGCIDPLFFPDQDLDPGSPGIELPLMRERANLLTHPTTAAFLVIDAQSGSKLAFGHVTTSFLGFNDGERFGSIRNCLCAAIPKPRLAGEPKKKPQTSNFKNLCTILFVRATPRIMRTVDHDLPR
jgi:hypothetical protein